MTSTVSKADPGRNLGSTWHHGADRHPIRTQPGRNTAAPMAPALRETEIGWAGGLVSLGALARITPVIMILIPGQARVAFSMSRDGLLPTWPSKPHHRWRTSYRITIVTGLLVAVLAAFTPNLPAAELVNIGTLFAFTLVSVGVIVLRRTRPDLPRAFHTPLSSQEIH